MPRRERSGHKSAPRQLVDEAVYRGTMIIGDPVIEATQVKKITEIRNMALPGPYYSRATVDVGLVIRRQLAG